MPRVRTCVLDVADDASLRRALAGQWAVLSAAPFHLTARIAEADAKHPRDLEDGGWGSIRDAKRALFDARNTLEENPMWSNALRCEVEEAMYDLAATDFHGACSELLDVATVAMRWRRAVMGRAK